MRSSKAAQRWQEPWKLLGKTRTVDGSLAKRAQRGGREVARRETEAPVKTNKGATGQGRTTVGAKTSVATIQPRDGCCGLEAGEGAEMAGAAASEWDPCRRKKGARKKCGKGRDRVRSLGEA